MKYIYFYLRNESAITTTWYYVLIIIHIYIYIYIILVSNLLKSDNIILNMPTVGYN